MVDLKCYFIWEIWKYLKNIRLWIVLSVVLFQKLLLSLLRQSNAKHLLARWDFPGLNYLFLVTVSYMESTMNLPTTLQSSLIQTRAERFNTYCETKILALQFSATQNKYLWLSSSIWRMISCLKQSSSPSLISKEKQHRSLQLGLSDITWLSLRKLT